MQIATRRSYSMSRPFDAVVAEMTQGITGAARLAARIGVYLAGTVSSIFNFRTAPADRPAAPRITPRPIQPPPPEALPLLTEAIVGSSKYTIASVLGAPRSAVVEGLAAIETSETGAFYQTDTWYYPLPRHGHIAMAVTFAGDVARRVEFFQAPSVEIQQSTPTHR